MVLYVFDYLSFNELKRALQATLTQFDQYWPQYSLIDVATKKKSCPDMLVPALQQQQTHPPTEIWLPTPSTVIYLQIQNINRE